MAYFVDSNGNSKKVGAIIKTTPVIYKHRVKMQGTISSSTFVVYADVYSNDNTSWVGSTCANKLSGWNGFIAGKGSQGDYLFQYMKCNNQNQAILYVDYADQTANYEVLDSTLFEIVTDVVTPI